MLIQDFIKKIPANIIKNAKAFQGKVRELEEANKGIFQAFVDDENDSYDVSISFDAGAHITFHSCDCPSKSRICAHQAAVLIQLSSGDVKKDTSILAKKIRKKKITPEEELLDTLSTDKIKEWLADLLKNDKELLLKFLSKFSTNEVIVSRESIEENYITSLKAVAGRKKYLDASQIQRTLDLMTPLHQSVIADFSENKLKSLDISLLIDVNNAINKLYYSVKNSTTKIKTYKEKFWASIFEKLDLENVKIIGDFLHKLTYEFNDKYIAILFLKQHPDILMNARLKILLQDTIRKVLEANLTEERHLEFLNVFVNNQVFEKYSDQFSIVRYANKYNIPLIDQFIIHGKYERAKIYITEAMKYNTRAKYNIPYIELRKKITIFQN